MVRDALGDDDVLHRDGHAGERTGIFAAGDPLDPRGGGGQGAFGGEMQVGVGLRILGFGEAQRFGGQFDGAEVAGEQSLASRDRWSGRNVHARSAFDDFRHFEIAGAGLGRVGQGSRVAERRHRHIGAQRGGFPGVEEHLRHGLDARGVDFVELVHMLQDAIEIGLKFGDLGVGEGAGWPGPRRSGLPFR